ncbi:DUF4192 domain-containing protein [Lapillicoccus jejuensis]|uniref:Uncharacterized protein DUF4192 n=1 Tax=Lapillicoccus jejuensis TaxID=402171 RepID=A0A542E6V3_9MICO|nr:DUF4192 domain-containing protein [Lapillicoccus jejuensis]TQJ11044.1 uncharacterized protein DUF4192 [Lapillicoccus jejuensis]
MSTTPRPPRPASPASRAEEEDVIRLHSPGDVLTTLPYQLGYVPERSLVVLTLRGKSVFFVGRVDLPPRTASGREAAAALLVPLSRHRFDRALVVTVEDALVADADQWDGGAGVEERTRAGCDPVERRRAAPRSWTDLAREVCAGLRALGVQVDERITVRDGMWWCPDGTARERRPQRLPGAGDVAAVAEFVGRGRVPLRHRDDLAAMVVGSPEEVRDAGEVDDLVTRFTGGGADRRSLLRAAAAAWARFVADDPGGADPDDVPLLLASLHDVPLRDLVLAWLCPRHEPGPSGSAAAEGLHGAVGGDPPLGGLVRVLGPGPEQGRGHLVAALTRLCRACPPGRGAPVLAALAHVAWWHGDGALARVAVDAAREHDRDHGLAALLEQVLDLAVAPEHVA